MRDFVYRGFARWFPPILYFWLLGPFAAAVYRLVELSNTGSNGRFEVAQNVLDWLPARLLLLTFSLLGDFERSRGVLTRDAFDNDVSSEVLLATGIERAWQLDEEDLNDPQGLVKAVETTQKAINRATGVWVVMLSLLALV
jgi:AmpE protein